MSCNNQITIPVGPTGATGATGAQGVAGTNGTNGTNGTSACKYTATWSVISPGVSSKTVNIPYATIVACNAFTNSCYTQLGSDMIISAYFSADGVNYKLITHNSAYIDSIICDNTNAQVTITYETTTAGNFRCVFMG